MFKTDFICVRCYFRTIRGGNEILSHQDVRDRVADEESQKYLELVSRVIKQRSVFWLLTVAINNLVQYIRCSTNLSMTTILSKSVSIEQTHSLFATCPDFNSLMHYISFILKLSCDIKSAAIDSFQFIFKSWFYIPINCIIIHYSYSSCCCKYQLQPFTTTKVLVRVRFGGLYV